MEMQLFVAMVMSLFEFEPLDKVPQPVRHSITRVSVHTHTHTHTHTEHAALGGHPPPSARGRLPRALQEETATTLVCRGECKLTSLAHTQQKRLLGI